MNNFFSRLASLLLVLVALSVLPTAVRAQGPGGRSFGFGVIFPNPTGGTIKLWLNHEQALDFYIGSDYFGGPRIGGDFLWHFFPFSSPIANMYAGFGGAVGMGNGAGGFWYRDHSGWYYRSDGASAIGIRGLFGIDVVPRNVPLEFFFELGPMFGLSPSFGTVIDAAIGVRLYP